MTLGQDSKNLLLTLLICSIASSQICGDRKLNGKEICDNGNTTQNGADGCFNNCTVHPRFQCTKNKNVASFCYPICGDGVVIGNERARGFCDDGNRKNGDGCSDWCQIEANWTCSGAPSKCRKAIPPKPLTPVCGNQKIQTGETCDDGNTVNQDGYTSTCLIETDFTCSGSPSNCYIASCQSKFNPDSVNEVQKMENLNSSNLFTVDSAGKLVLVAPNSVNVEWQIKSFTLNPQFVTLLHRQSNKFLMHNIKTNHDVNEQAWCFYQYNPQYPGFFLLRNRKTGHFLSGKSREQGYVRPFSQAYFEILLMFTNFLKI